MTLLLFVVLLLAGTAAVIAPLARRPIPWPADPPDTRDDAARAVSSLRDLEFARAAGTIAPADYARLRSSLERDAFARRGHESRGTAPVRTLIAASLIAAVAVGVAVFYLPPSAGDRAPGETVTGTVPQTNALASLEARASANPTDIPTQLALADGYVQAGRPQDAIPRYQAVLDKDPNNIAALDGLALILVRLGRDDGAILAADRVLTQRPKDPDALFVKGLALYRKQDWKGAVDVWTVYLDVGQYHPASEMVRGLYAEARTKERGRKPGVSPID
jgi:cytochrome c-type biogenesis protein CcmH/NrfG